MRLFGSDQTSMALEALQDRLSRLEKGLQAVVDGSVSTADLEHLEREINQLRSSFGKDLERNSLDWAELYGKTYRLLKRMQQEARADLADTTQLELVEDQPAPQPVDETTARILARRAKRNGVSAVNEG